MGLTVRIGGDETVDPLAFNDPRRNETAIPCSDNDTATLIREAVVTLTIFRAPMGLGDAGATVSVLVSLPAEADGQLGRRRRRPRSGLHLGRDRRPPRHQRHHRPTPLRRPHQMEKHPAPRTRLTPS